MTLDHSPYLFGVELSTLKASNSQVRVGLSCNCRVHHEDFNVSQAKFLFMWPFKVKHQVSTGKVTMNTAIVTLKKQLRKDMAARLEQLSTPELIKQSDQVFQRLQQLSQFQTSKNVSIYISMPTCEIMTTNIIQHLLRSDKNCYIPRCTKNNMDMVKITSIEDFESLPINKWNIPEPPLDQARANALDEDGNGLDLILVPGVAFDQNRNRIGHGKGYYDRYIRKSNAWADEKGIARPKTIALSLNEQIVDIGTIPLEETDQTLDCILTPANTF